LKGLYKKLSWRNKLSGSGLSGEPAGQLVQAPRGSETSQINRKYGVEQIFKEYRFEGASNY
jgi:hypothetical protein